MWTEGGTHSSNRNEAAPSRRLIRAGQGFALLALVGIYYLAGRLGLEMASIHPSASPVWPPTGIALAAVLVYGNLVSVAVFAGAFLVNMNVTGASLTSLGIAVGNTLEALIGAILIRRLAGGLAAFQSPYGILKFLAAGPLVSTMISATVGVTSLCVGGHASWQDFAGIWLTWWLGDAAGATILTPALLMWLARPGSKWNLPRFPEAALVTVVSGGASLVLFGGDGMGAIVQGPTTFAMFPLVIWAGLRFGTRGAATIAALIGGVAVWGTLRGHGPFSPLAPNTGLLLLQMFASVLSVTGLLLGTTFGGLREFTLDLEQRVRERTKDLEQSNDALRRMEARFRRLLESAPDAMVIVDPEGRIALVNSRTRAIFGYESDELVGRPVEVLVPDRFRSVHVSRRAGYFAHPRTRPMGSGLDLFGRRKDGSEFAVEIQLSPIETEEGMLIAGAIRDVSDRRAAEQEIRRLNEHLESKVRERTRELESANRDLDAFTYTVAHDLRAPLRALDSFSRIIGAEHASGIAPEGRRLLASIERNVRRMGDMIDGLLAFARSSRGELNVRTVLPAALVRESWEELSAARSGRTVEFSVGDLPACRAEPKLLKHVFLNLLDNALKFSRDRNPARISVGWKADAASGAFFVKDNGVGFDMKHAEKMFEVFERLHGNEEFEGAGAGLAIVKRIIQRHGGRIWAESRPDGGATFYFSVGA